MKPRTAIKKGDRVRLKVHALGCRKGTTGTIVETPFHEDTVCFLKDGSTETCHACRHEVAKMHDQTPNPEHLEIFQRDDLVLCI